MTGVGSSAQVPIPKPFPVLLLAVILIIAVVIAGMAIGTAVWPGLPIALRSQIFLEVIGGLLLLLAFGLAAYCVFAQMEPAAANNAPNHPRSLGIAVAINLVVLLCLILILTVGMTLFKVDTTLSLPIMAIAGVVALIGTLSLTAISFSIMNLADKSQPLGLPQGSVRAVIALSLVVLFAILTVYLFSSLNNSGAVKEVSCVAAKDYQNQLKTIKQSGAQILVNVISDAGCGPAADATNLPNSTPAPVAIPPSVAASAPAAPVTSAEGSIKIHGNVTPNGGAASTKPSARQPIAPFPVQTSPGATGSLSPAPAQTGASQSTPPNYDIQYVMPLANQNAIDFAKQLLVLIGTLVTSVASFYFGSQAVSQAQSVVTGSNVLPSLTGVDTTSVEIGNSQTIGILGSGLNGITQAQLSPQNSSLPPIAAKSVTSNNSRVQAVFDIPSQNLELNGSLDVIVSDAIGRTARLPNALKVVAPSQTANSSGQPNSLSSAQPSDAAPAVKAAAAALTQEADNLAALKQLPVGNPAKPPQTVEDDVAKAQQALAPFLRGSDPSTASTALQLAQQALDAAQKQGLPGALADVISTLQGVASFAGPIVTGIPGGPPGIVAGVLLAGLQLYQNQAKFNALKAALLNAPFNPAQPPVQANGDTAMAALQASPLFAAVPAVSANPVKALTVMQAALPAPDGSLPSTATLAAALLASPDVGKELQAAFTVPQLAGALDQLRATNVFSEARSLLTGTVNTSGLVANGSTVSLSSLLDAARKLTANPTAGAAIEQLVGIAEAIAKAPNSATVAGQLKDALTAATTIAATARQTA